MTTTTMTCAQNQSEAAVRPKGERAPPLRVSYVLNQHPLVSTTFIRREMQALERKGVMIDRIAVRGWNYAVPDAADRQEQARTWYVLEGGIVGLMSSVFRTITTRPTGLLSATRLALQMSRRSAAPLWKHVVYLIEACRIAERVRSQRTQHLHAHFGTNSAEIAMLAGAIECVPYSFTIHGPEEFDQPLALGIPRKIALSVFTAAISSFARSQLYRWAPLSDWPKIKVIRCGVDPDFYEDVPPSAPDSTQFVCVGRLSEQKGQLVLLEAMHILQRNSNACSLVLAGDGEMRGALEKRINDLGLSERVTITGWVDNDRVRELLLQSRALLLPSFAEGIPVAIMEAMLLRRPVITTYVGGIPELVEPGLSGWLVPAGDATALAAAVKACLEADPTRLVAMGEAAYHRARQLHDSDRQAEQMLAAFGGTVQDTPGY